MDADAADGNWYLRNVGFSPNAPIYEDLPNILRPLIAMPTLHQRVGNRYRQQPAPIAEATVFCKDPAQNFRCSLKDEQAAYYVSENGSVALPNGVWGRVHGFTGRYEPDLSTSGGKYDTNMFGLQAGLDRLLHEGGSGRVIGGLSLNYGHVNGKSGSASVSSDGIGVSGSLTWYGNNGFYLDAQSQTVWFNNDLSSSLFGSLTDDNDGFAYAFSQETGKRFALDERWALTPQAQLTYANMDFNSFTDQFGAHVSLDRGDSLRGRLGLAAEYQHSWKEEDGTTSRFKGYGIANIYNEFLDGTKVMVFGSALESRNDRVWGGIGLGGTHSWDDDRISLYGEIAANTSLADFGDSYELNGTLGLRVNW